MIGILTSVLPGLFSLGGKLIEDKDKRAEYAFRVQQMTQDMAMKLLETQTYPWIDGLVKLAYAGEAIIKGLFRPIVSACMTGFVVYAEVSGIQLSAAVEGVLIAAFPAWGVSRHVSKKKETEDF